MCCVAGTENEFENAGIARRRVLLGEPMTCLLQRSSGCRIVFSRSVSHIFLYTRPLQCVWGGGEDFEALSC